MNTSIAVIGMAGRFPGANSVEQFWSNLVRGEESIVTLSEEMLAAAGVTADVLANAAYVRRAPILDGIDEFDADFFGFSPQAARTMDPQHRLFLQCAWHALEDAGADPGSFDGSIGVFGTCSTPGYLVHNLLSHHDPETLIAQGANIEQLNLFLQNDKDFLATRVSHQFDLRGPSLTVQTACSSSLVALHLACQSLLGGECDMALAGAASLRIPHHVGYWHDPGSMVSAVGHCRPFDVRADGTVFGSGVAAVVLKPLQAAVDDGDRIHAVIRGTALNNDGSMKMGYAAPNAAAQAEVIAEAHAVSGVDASTIGYVECHGTGTPLGDPIEIDGLRRAFAASDMTRPGSCVLGAVKSNIGHLEVAAGIAALIKTILCLKHRAIPATLHYTRPNPELRLDQSPFVVRTEYGPWDADGVRRAGVSSFGVGGTNAHAVLEEAPQLPARDVITGPQVLLLSARTAETLQESRVALADELAGADPQDLADVAFTLTGRRRERVRVAAVVHDHRHAAAVLEASEHDNVFVGECAGEHDSRTDRVIFLFPGQGAQHPGMARGLYESEPEFARHFDLCADGFRAELDIDLRTEVFDGTVRALERTDRAQPALFAVEYALAKLVGSYGVRAAAMAGHSIGEYVAATLAGVFDLASAIKAVAARARLMHGAPPGVMVAVPMSAEAIAQHLCAGVDLAAVNDPGSCVVAGAEADIRLFEGRLAEHGVPARRVRTAHAFHSAAMDSVVGEFEDVLSGVTLHEPRIPLLSNVTGTWLSAGEATAATTWARQIRATVRFADELDVMLADPGRVLVEVGPGGALTASATRHPRWTIGHCAVRLMRHQVQNKADRDAFLLGLGQLASAGVDVDWTPLWGSGPRRVSLPGYPFARQRHWVDHRKNTADWVPQPNTNGAAPHVETGRVRTDGSSNIETILQRTWAQCLGLASVDRSANFFELGGDSLIAIGVAASAGRQGVDITPQDLYEHQTVAALAAELTSRYAAGGLAAPPDDLVNPAVPPNVAYFLEHGVRDAGRWRTPLILRLRSDVTVADVRAVLTAVTNHHDALRLRVTERAGIPEQHIAEPHEFEALQTSAGDPAEILAEQVRDATSQPLTATYVPGGDAAHLVITLHGMAADNDSREILLADMFTAFGQRLAGEDITLQPATTTWGEWSRRAVALATHPAVVESRDYWLPDRATLRLAGQAGPPCADDLVRLSSTLTSGQSSAVDDARRRLAMPAEQILLAALGRAIAVSIGDGVVAVDLVGQGRSVLKPNVDVSRTVGWFATIYPFALTCAREVAARQLLDDLHQSVKAVPHYGIGHGLLRYLYAPTSALLGARAPADIFFSYQGTIPELPPVDAPVQFDPATLKAMREAIPGLGHAIELRAFRYAGALHLDWWYDVRRLNRSTVESLVGRFPTILTELIAEAVSGDHADAADETLALVDLSLADFVGDEG